LNSKIEMIRKINSQRIIFAISITLVVTLFNACGNSVSKNEIKNMTPLLDSNCTDEKITNNKLVIYQLMTRLFGNTNSSNVFYGTRAQNGCGKFDDINQKALSELKKFGVSHVWFTGALEHATMSDYSEYGISQDDADVVKGRAGSPYAIKDYYDVNPDLANDVKNRMAEFEALLKRTHDAGLKSIIDFVPNHVARSYGSDAKPNGVKDLGENDNKGHAFNPANNFYYLLNQKFIVPADYNPMGTEKGLNENQVYDEYPAKATGNNVFSPTPSKDDWFETAKLNYGVDIQGNQTKYFDPIPDTWNKMTDILLYWAAKGVDGFRCDMAEMVPVEFWNYAIGKVQQKYPAVIFVAEIYNPAEYRNYINQGKFNYIYDKVGMYDALRRLIEDKGKVNDITHCWKYETNGISNHLVRFLENHDEQRIASPLFGKAAKNAFGAMAVSATLGSGPVLIYFGREVGEAGAGAEGFGGDDGRTSIFDYWGVPAHQAWMNNHKYEGALLNDEQRSTRNFYNKILRLCLKSSAIQSGYFYDLQEANAEKYTNNLVYSYIRYDANEAFLISVNFSTNAYQGNIFIPENVIKQISLPQETKELNDELTKDMVVYNPNEGVKLNIQPKQAAIVRLR